MSGITIDDLRTRYAAERERVQADQAIIMAAVPAALRQRYVQTLSIAFSDHLAVWLTHEADHLADTEWDAALAAAVQVAGVPEDILVRDRVRLGCALLRGPLSVSVARVD